MTRENTCHVCGHLDGFDLCPDRRPCPQCGDVCHIAADALCGPCAEGSDLTKSVAGSAVVS